MKTQFSLSEVIIIVSFLLFGCVMCSAEHSYADVEYVRLTTTKNPGDIWVMVIDTGIGRNSMLEPYVQYKNTVEYQDDHGHGTHVAGIVAYGNRKLNDPLCKRVKIFSCKYYYIKQPSKTEDFDRCMYEAVDMKMDYVNISGGGLGFMIKEYHAFTKYNEIGGKVVVAAGNDYKDLAKWDYYPASYALGSNTHKFKRIPNITVVMNENWDGTLYRNSNYTKDGVRRKGVNIYSTLPNNHLGYMTGTSMAAPAYLHEILQERCKEMQ